MEKHCESAKRFGKEGNGKAAKKKILESFIRDSGKKAYKFAYNLAGNEDEARELVQDALYRAMLAWDRYDPRKPLIAWFQTILRNAFIEGCRRRKRTNAVSWDCPIGDDERHSYSDVIADKEEGIETALQREEDGRLARQVLERMRPKHREVLTLCDMKGLKYQEIAAALSLRVGTVRSRLSNARRSFRGTWSQSGMVA